MIRKTGFIVVLLALGLAAGCGKSSKDKAQEEKMRVPDSLLAPIAAYHLTVDEYHPIRGGVMANQQIELHYPASPFARLLAVKTFGYVRDGYEKVAKEIGRPTEGKLVIIGSTDLDEYRVLTRKEWWYYGYVKGDTIYFEPYDIMIQRHIADVGYTQRIAQVALNRRSGGRIPLWLREAVASRLSGEGAIIKMQMEEFRLAGQQLDFSPDEIEIAIGEGVDRYKSRVAYYDAYRMLENLLAFASMNDVYMFLDKLREGLSLDEASRAVFGMSYGALIDRVRVDRPGRGR
jgi:hypothetical protein